MNTIYLQCKIEQFPKLEMFLFSLVLNEKLCDEVVLNIYDVHCNFKYIVEKIGDKYYIVTE